MGHKNIETTMIYLHTNLMTMRQGVEKLDFVITGKMIGTNMAHIKKTEPVSSGFSITKKCNGAEGETRTPMARAATPSRWCVYQFHHFGMNRKDAKEYREYRGVPAKHTDFTYLIPLKQQIIKKKKARMTSGPLCL